MVLSHSDITARICWIGSLSPEVLHSYFMGGPRGLPRADPDTSDLRGALQLSGLRSEFESWISSIATRAWASY